jgi:two-component system, NtrC family, nitrogen regulation sensor histidine kinase NtrY
MKLILKYRLILLAIFASVLFAVVFSSITNPSSKSFISSFQEHFSKKESESDRFLAFQKDKITHQGDYGKWDSYEQKKEPFLHIFKKDSLIYWNTNQLPVLQFKDVHFPAEGLIHLQNGWYYSKVHEQDDFTVVATFLIRSEYAYENEALINEFQEDLSTPLHVSISLEEQKDYAIYSSKGDFLFSLIPDPQQPISESESLILILLLFAAISICLYAMFHYGRQLKPLGAWSVLVLVFLLRYLSLQFDWLDFMSDNVAFQPSLYASNEIFPNFFEYLINCGVLLFAAIYVSDLLQNLKKRNGKGTIGLLIILLSFGFWFLLIELTNGLIENSSIPLLIDRLFSLNAYSILAILSIGALYYGFYRLTTTGVKLFFDSKLPMSTLAVIIFLSSVLFFILEISNGTQIFLSAVFPLIFFGLVTYQVYSNPQRINIGISILYLFLFSSVTATNLSELSQRKEREERELFANQLASDKDVGIELEFAQLSRKLKQDPYLLKFATSPRRMNLSDFEDAVERRFFSGPWERYELNFNLFDTLGASLIADESQNFTYPDILDLIAKHGTSSEVNANMYFIKDYTDQYSYIIKQRLYEGDKPLNGILVCTLKSKKIPEEIGFPRLLISSKTNVFNSLENYSIARYHHGRLITKYGAFNFPTKHTIIKDWRNSNGFVDKDGYNHYILYKSSEDLIVLSGKNYSYIELITSFSYLFCFYGLLLLPSFFQTRSSNSPFKKAFSLAAKIQLVLIGLVFVSLLGFGWGSGIFVRNQYNTYTDDVIREKLNSVSIELRSKLGTKKELDLSKDGNYMEYLLRKFSRVFVTDINFYNTQGIMMASSRPKIYNTGLVSEQMNPSAFHAVSVSSKSEFIHQENIGKLSYSSAYLPFYNNEGNLLGYVNLQHFGQQEDFEAQIQRFLVAIINVFMLLLAISIILAIFISGWVTAPLRLLQESFAGMKFGKYNQQINYKNDDEIGALVKDYNEKLEELEYAAQQIAKNERETAWREMAKQVAHEIKNPLTPMKLSIQQLQRVYDPENPNSGEKLNKVAASLIEQIDALTKIANEFSNFAKMPHPNEIELDLKPLIESVIEVFRTERDMEITLKTDLDSVLLLADKDQMLRVFNNLIKNAIQSIPDDRTGEIIITVAAEGNQFRIAVKDNGNGIAESELNKIFVPYFTTKTTGTGLGLAMVRQIIENHRGTIDFKTEEGMGTTFSILLPALLK